MDIASYPSYGQGQDSRLLDSVVVYLDLLGTKERLENYSEEDLRSDLEAVAKLRHILDSQAIMRSHWFLSFTDDLVIGAPLDGHSTARQLRFLLTAVAGYQLGYMAHGQLLRGGVCHGQFHGSRQLVTGAALGKAVGIEQKIAKTPRVVIDLDCYRAIIPDGVRDDSDVGMGMQWNDLLVLDEDDRLFVNYLVAAGHRKVPADIEDALLRHRSLVLDGLATHSEERVRSKYVWMAQYHDFVQKKFFPDSDASIGRNDLEPRKFALPKEWPLAHAASALRREADQLDA